MWVILCSSGLSFEEKRAENTKPKVLCPSHARVWIRFATKSQAKPSLNLKKNVKLSQAIKASNLNLRFSGGETKLEKLLRMKFKRINLIYSSQTG